jgi:glycosyltransferase involved in cell wall biosynthesis
MVDVVAVRTSFVVFDPRVFKIVNSLRKRYTVLVLGWNRKGDRSETKANYVVDLNLFNFKTRFGAPTRFSYFYMIFYFSIFWIWVLIKLIKNRPKVVHAFDLDSLIPCLIYKTLFRKKIVFDATVRYAMAYIPTKFRSLYSAINSLEERLASRADVLINGWDKELSTFRRRPKQCVTIINCTDDYSLDQDKAEKNKNANKILKLVYTGGIRTGRALDNIASAVKDLDDVEFILAGLTVDKKLLEEILKIPNVKYEGFLESRDALVLEASADAMIGLYDMNVPWNSITAPSKHFEAMMCGIPIITNASSELVNDVDCGILVDYDDVEQIRAAVTSLRDVELRTRLGRNGRAAFLEKYNWTKMEEMIFEIYDNLMQK